MPLTERSISLRATRVGASEVGAVMGVDPFRGPMSVWERLVLGKTKEPSSAMRLGSELEIPIAKAWAARSGVRFRANDYTRTDGHLAATADGFAREALVEIKLSFYGGIWANGLPEHVRWQAVAQSCVYHRPLVIVVALIAGELREYEVRPTRDERRECRAVVDAFMARHVDTGEIPMPLFPDELLSYLHLVQGTKPDERRPATDEEQEAAVRYLAIRTSLRAYEREAEQSRAELLSLVSSDPRPRIVGDGFTVEISNEPRRITVHQNRSRTEDAE